jgi:predicted RNase H-like nuclease (RuvC/YqgF family)
MSETATAKSETKNPRRIFQALTPNCARMIATVNIPAKDGYGPVAKVKEMDRMGRFVVEADELYYAEHVKALRLFCEKKPTYLKELREGVDAVPSKATLFAFGPKQAETDAIQEARRLAAEATEQWSKADKTISDKETEIKRLTEEKQKANEEMDALKARLAKLEKGIR